MKKIIQCSSCNGLGRTLQEGQSAPKTCPKCSGTGKIVQREESGQIRESRYLAE